MSNTDRIAISGVLDTPPKAEYGASIQRMSWVDNARILAIFFVILLHVSASVLERVEYTSGLYWWTGNIYDSFARWCIPVFVMLSGILLLDPRKDESSLNFYKKRASRVLIPLIFWTLFFLGWTFLHEDSVTPQTLLSRTVSGVPYFHLWFLYMILGLYLLTPFLRKIVGQLSDKELLFLCVLLFFFSIVFTAIKHLYSLNQVSALLWFVIYLPYFLVGHLIDRADARQAGTRALVVIFILAGATTAIGFDTSVRNSGGLAGNSMYFYDYLSINVVIMSVCLMFLLRRTSIRFLNPGISRRLAGLTLGIYLIHPLFIELFNSIGFEARAFNPIVSILLITIVVFCLALLASMIISVIPVVKRVI